MDECRIARVSDQLRARVLQENLESKARLSLGTGATKKGKPITKHITIDIGCIRYCDLTGLEYVLHRTQIALHKIHVKPTFEAVALTDYAWFSKAIEPRRVTVTLTGKSRAAVAERINHIADDTLASLQDRGLERCSGQLEMSKERVLALLDQLDDIPDWVWEEEE